MSTKIDEGCFVTQRGNRKLGDRVDVDQLEEMVASVTQTSQSTLLLKKKKEMREVDDALEFMKDEYNTRMGNCDQREAEFEQKQMEMRDQVLKFEKFIQENDAKRTRAETKAKQEHRILDQRAQELRKLEKELASAMDEERKLKEQRHRLKRYQEYLLGTVSSSEQDVEEINDLLNRQVTTGKNRIWFHTLSEANKDLMKLCEDGDSAYERRRAETQQYRQDKQNEVLVTNSELNERQIELEQIRGGVKRAEHESEQEGERVKGICRESGQVMLAIKNLYSRQAMKILIRNLCKQTMRARLPDMNDKHLDRMQFLERCLYCLNLVRERIE
ncbi:unnamed protein product, partial [Choristocarpus tenellus]